MNGLLLVDKPKGITSFDVIRHLRRTTEMRKIGHAGTLDPMATGLMLLLFGTACKKAADFSKLDKTYVADITLGAVSATGDAEGELKAVSTKVPALVEVEAALQLFTGMITQTPSVYSAIKINGQEAYKRARLGEAVEMPSRQVTVYAIKLINYDYPLLKLEASVSSGTYIRSLAEDIGIKLETGAYLSGLIRTRVGGFDLKQALELDGIDQKAAERALRSV